MKPIITLFCVVVALLPATALTKETDDFLSNFILGTYHLIGKAPDSENTYYGKVEIANTDDGLRITRIIGGKTVAGTAAIEKSLDNIQVLRMRFVEHDLQYEETCMIDSDLDNYARITCYLYQPDKETDDPGLEALFVVHEKD